ncbi:MAG: DUF4249 domain-containing protein [Bacteroidota bacterium]
MTSSHPTIRLFVLAIFWLGLATSCEESVDLDIVIQEPQVVVNSTFVPGEPFKVFVSKSQNVLSSEPNEYINNAAVRILNQQGEVLEQLQLRNLRTPHYSSRNIHPENGKVYRLEVAIPGQETIIAEDNVPLPVALDHIKVDTLEMFGDQEAQVYKVSVAVHFKDPIGAQDYYHLSLFNRKATHHGMLDGLGPEGSEKNSWSPLMPLESDENNPAVTFHYEDGGVLFTDEAFDGQPTQLTFYSLLSLDEAAQGSQIVGELKTVSRAYYLFQTSLSRQIANRDRPFVEPISVYSNIENGLGIFSGYAVYRDSVAVSSSLLDN